MSKNFNLIPDMYKDDPEVIAVLKAEDYWEWRTTIEEMKQQELKVELTNTKQKLLDAELRCASLQNALFKHSINQVMIQRDKMKKDYDDNIKKLEDKYKISLKDCIIGDINYEVRKTK